MVTTTPFLNALAVKTSDGAHFVNIAGTPGDDLTGYRVVGYRGASPNWVTTGVYVLPAGTIIPASGVKRIALYQKFTNVSLGAIGLAEPNVDPDSTSGRLWLYHVFTASLTVSDGVFAGYTSVYADAAGSSDVGTSGTNHLARVGTGSTADPSTFTWAINSGTTPSDATNTGQTLTISPPPEDPEDPETPEDPSPLAAAVLAFLGQTGNAALVPQVEQHVEVVRLLAKLHTRGNGFTDDAPDSTIESVIVTATARLVANPEQLDTQVGTTSIRGAFRGWSLVERMTLDAYRGVAQ